MKDKKKILIIVMVVVGVLLLIYGGISLSNINSKNTNTNKTENVEQPKQGDDYDPNSYNEQRDLAKLEKGLVITEFKYKNKDNQCEFEFTITNNSEVEVKNDLLKVYFYDKNKTLLNTFDLNITSLGVHDLMGIQSSIEVKGEASIFEYEFNNVKHEITIK